MIILFTKIIISQFQDSIRYEDSTLDQMQNSMLELNLGAKQKKSMTNTKKTSTKANFPGEAVTKLNEPCDSKNKICDKINKSVDSDDRDELLEEDLDGICFPRFFSPSNYRSFFKSYW